MRGGPLCGGTGSGTCPGRLSSHWTRHEVRRCRRTHPRVSFVLICLILANWLRDSLATNEYFQSLPENDAVPLIPSNWPSWKNTVPNLDSNCATARPKTVAASSETNTKNWKEKCRWDGKKYLKKNRETTSWWRHWALKQNQFSPDHPSLYFFLIFFCENIFCPLDKSFQLWRKGTTKDCDQLKYLPTLFFSKDTTRYKHHAITEAYASEGPRHLWNNIQLFVQKTKLASHAPFYNFFFLFFHPLAEEQESIKRKILLSNTSVPQNNLFLFFTLLLPPTPPSARFYFDYFAVS